MIDRDRSVRLMASEVTDLGLEQFELLTACAGYLKGLSLSLSGVSASTRCHVHDE